MATKNLNVRINNKYDSYDNWAESKIVLGAGELAIATVTTAQKDDFGNIIQVPNLMIKVGDGSKTFAQLPWLSAKAADVADWAKAAERPTYAAGEITGIDAYIAAYVNDKMGISVDTDTQYKIVANGTNGFKLQSKGKTDPDTAWADVPGSTFAVDFTAVNTRIAGVEALHAIDDKTGKMKAVGVEISEAITALDLANTYASKTAYDKYVEDNNKAIADYKAANDALVKANGEAIEAIKDGTTLDSFADVEAKIGTLTKASVALEIADAKSKAEAYAKEYADGKDDAIAGALTAGTGAQQYAEALAAKVGTVAEGSTLAGIVSDLGTNLGNDIDALEALHATDEQGNMKAVGVEISEAITGLNLANTYASKATYEAYVAANDKAVAANTAAITKLNGDDKTEGSVKKHVADEIAKIVAENNNASIDTLNEIAAWIVNDKTGAAQMSNAIEANADAIDAIKDGTVLDSFKDVEDKIGALTENTVAAEIEAAKTAAIEEATGHVEAVEADIAALKALHTVDEEGKMKAVSVEISEAIEDIAAASHTHDNDTVLDGISAEKVAAWDAATDRIGTADDVLVFNCGTASTII